MAITDYSTNPNLNTNPPPAGAPEGMAPSGVNNVLRQLMADLATLPASSGAALIGSLRSETGVSAATLAELHQGLPLNLKTDFGAVGDGVADDTDAIAAAITACQASYRPLYIPAGTYLCSSTITINTIGTHIFGDGWYRTKIKFTAAVDGLVISQVYGSVRGIWFDGNSVGLTGVTYHNAARSLTEDCYFGAWTTDGARINQTYTTPTGNNNYLRVSRSFFNSNTGRGFTMPTKQSDGNAVELLQVECASNSAGGLLIKGQNWRVFFGRYDGNTGYGIELAEDGDASSSTSSYVYCPWVESNSAGGVRGSAKAQRNRLVIDALQQSYTAAAGAENIVEIVNNSSGPLLSIGDGTVQTYIRSVSSTRAQIHAEGSLTNIPLYIFGKGNSGVHLDPFNMGGVSIGGASNAKVTKYLSTTATLNFPSTATNSSSDLTITLSGVLADGSETVALGVPAAAVTSDSCYTAWASAANTITVRFNNYSAGAIDPGSATFRVSVWQH